MRLSIITINYNNKSGLLRTINSIIEQSVKEFEWIVIDGGSTDGSRELIDQSDQYITYWCSERDGGIYNAMNKGIRAAKGEYLLFMNSGDCLFSRHVIKDFLSWTYTHDFIYGYLINRDSLKKKTCYSRDELTAADFLNASLPHQATFIRKDTFERFGMYDESYKIVSDWKFFLEAIVFNNASVKYVDVPVAIFDNEGISSGMNNKHREEREKVLHEFFPERILSDLYRAASLKETVENRFCSRIYSLIYRLATSDNYIHGKG